MAERDLAYRLLTTPALQRQLQEITLWTTAEQFKKLERAAPIIAQPSVESNYLLTCASILALSDAARCQEAALRIATYIFSAPSSTSLQRDAAAIVLDELTNTPALRLAERRHLVEPNAISRVPLPLRLDALQRAARYSELDADGDTVHRVNRFQKQVYDAYRDAKWLSISAPTSAGKTHAVLHLIREFVASRPACVVIFIVPTRALIQQVEGDLRTVIGRLPGVLISSVPQLPSEWMDRRMTFVFTQERLHLLMNDAPADFAPHIVIVDEAQKIGDGARGVLLQDVLDAVVRRAPDVRILFASPMTSNPNVLLDDAPVGVEARPVVSEQVAVNQNLLWVSQPGTDTREWQVAQCIGDATIPIGSLRLPNRPTSEGKRLPMLAHMLADPDGGSLVYVDGAAAAEKTAQLLWDLQPELEGGPDPELQALIDLTRSVVHDKYVLAVTLERRVAFHYGNMPLIIRSEIERLFKDGKIRFLVCTSTLVEGVNLPAQSIFVRGPKKGRNTPMSEMDFWNLAGRAGRLGREFQGNVICVDPYEERVWGKRPPRARERYEIVKTLDAIVANRADDLAEYIEGDTQVAVPGREALEHAFVYFYGEYRRRGSLANSPIVDKYSAAFIDRMDGLCAAVAAKIDVPDDLIFRNPGVSPLALKRLITYFRNKKDIEDLIPAFPEDPKAAERYVKVIGRISTYLSGDPQALNWPHAILVVSWMRGHPLARLITQAAEYWTEKAKKPKTLPNVIRDTMRDVEEFARFRFAKYSSCYVDVLRYHLRTISQAELAENIPRLSIWLEFGASQGTQIALMGLGLSRTTAIHLSEIIAADNLDLQGAMTWIAAAELETLDISPIMAAEIRRVRETVT